MSASPANATPSQPQTSSASSVPENRFICLHCITLSQYSSEQERNEVRTVIKDDGDGCTSYFRDESSNYGPFRSLGLESKICTKCANLYSHNITYR